MYDCVLFDIDGTLNDSAEGIVKSVEYALERMGFEAISEEQRRLYVGPPLLESLQTINGMTLEQAMEGVRLFRERFNEIGWKENRVYEGIPRLLRSLKRKGVYLGVATAKPVIFAERVLEYFGLSQYFDCVSAAPMDESGLPKEEIIRRALPADCKNPAMVGDRLYDIIGAKKAGVRAIGVLYGYGTSDELVNAGADVLCEKVEGLSKYLLESDSYEPGAFITFEGIDTCGKSTQMGMLKDWLIQCGWKVTCTREPGGTPVGEKIRDILLSKDTGYLTPECEALLFAASRAQHVQTVIKPEVERGNIVLSDRYIDSSIAFQGYGREMGTDAVWGINAPAIKGIMPDVTLFYDLLPEYARERRHGMADRIEAEKQEFHDRVRRGFADISLSEPERVKHLDARQSRSELYEQTRALVMDKLRWKNIANEA